MFDVDDKVIISTFNGDCYNGLIGTIAAVGFGKSYMSSGKMWYYVAFDGKPPLSDMPHTLFSKKVMFNLLEANCEVTSNTDLYGKHYTWFKESNLTHV